MKPTQPTPVKLFIGLLFTDEKELTQAIEYLESQFGPIDYRSETFLFLATQFYAHEMSSEIYRIFIYFYSFSKFTFIKIDRTVIPSNSSSLKASFWFLGWTSEKMTRYASGNPSALA